MDDQRVDFGDYCNYEDELQAVRAMREELIDLLLDYKNVKGGKYFKKFNFYLNLAQVFDFERWPDERVKLRVYGQ